jgi:hypothetical protein
MTLTKTLLLDAASCALFALLCLGLTADVAALTGLPETVVTIAGAICAPVALLCAFLSSRPVRALLGVLAVGNLGWVLASAAVWIAYFGELTALGHGVILAQAVAVEVLTLVEWRGFRAMRPSAAAA